MDHGFGLDVPETLADVCHPSRLALDAFAIAGIALEVGIEPTVRHATDLGFLPVVVRDACGFRDRPAAERALAGFAFAGGSIVTDVATIAPLLRGARGTPS